MDSLNTTMAAQAAPNGFTMIEVMFVSTLSVLIAIANCLMGCELDLEVVVSTIKKPIAPAIGFFTQFILLPLIAYMIAQLVLVPRDLYPFALGLFVTGCSPAGGASNFWTLLLDGNVHLSITMTFISMVASVFMIPFWMNTLGYQFLHNDPTVAVKVPYRNIMSSLVILIVPLLIGIGIARKWPGVAAKARRTLRPFVIFVLVFVITVGTIANWHMFKHISLPAILSGFLLPFGGFTFGCLTSIMMKQKPKDVAAIAIETGVQNTGIAIMILKFSFPDADISMMIPVIVACSTPFPLLATYGIHSGIKWIKDRHSASVDPEKEQRAVSFNATASSPRTISPLGMYDKNDPEKPLIKNAQDYMTEEETVAYMEHVLDHVLTPGVIPD